MTVLRPLGRERVATTGAHPLLSATGWVVVALLAMAVGALAVSSATAVLGLLLVVLLLVLLTRPGVAAVLSVSTLPFSGPGLGAGGLVIGAPDVFMIVALAGWGIRDLLSARTDPPAAAVRPLAIGLVAYAAVAAATLVVHPSAVGLVTGLQRAYLVVGALLVGARLVRDGLLRPALGGYLVVATVLGAVAAAYSGDDSLFGVQKNPAGGFLAAALIIALVLRPYRWWWVVLPVLGVGTVSTQSRGALAGLVAGTLATLVLVRYRERVRVLVAIVAAAVLLYLTFENLPSGAQDRLRTLSGTSDFAIKYRSEFQSDALDAFRSQPWLGVGVGNYSGGVRQPGIGDPHQVVYYQPAEGGVLLLLAFIVLALVSIVVPLAYARLTRVAVVAIAVQISTLVHALGDVYWVRGTPVVAYVLIGATVAMVGYQRRGDARGDLWEVHWRVRRPDPVVVNPAVPELTAARHRA